MQPKRMPRALALAALAVATASLLPGCVFLPSLAVPQTTTAEPSSTPESAESTPDSLGELRAGHTTQSPSGTLPDLPLDLLIPPSTGTPEPLGLAFADESGAPEFDPASGPLMHETTGKLYIEYPDDLSASCTGTVVNSASGDVVLTAAHCIFNPEHRVMAERVRFVPGATGDSSPHGMWEAVRWIVPQSFADTAQQIDDRSTGEGWAQDFAWVLLAEDDDGRSIAEVTGGQGLSFRQEFTGAAFVGYPTLEPFDGTAQRICSQESLGFGDMHWPHLTMDCNVTQGISGAAWLTAVDGTTGAGYIGAVFSTLLPDRVSGAMLGANAHSLLLEIQDL